MSKSQTLFAVRKVKFALAVALLAVVGWGMTPQASATPITFYNVASTTTTDRFTIGCGSASGSCSGILEALTNATDPPVAPPSWSSTVGQLYDSTKSGIATETDFVNVALGGTPFSTGSQVDAGGAENVHFHTSAEYFLIKIGKGPNRALLHNLGDGTLDLYFTQTGTGAGFSHFTEFGTTGTCGADCGGGILVPEPSSLGLLGLGLIFIVGLIAWLPRQRKAHVE